MSLVAATVTKHQLLAYQNELEYKMTLIRQSKMSLSESATELINSGADLDPDSPAMKQLEQRKARLNQLEKKLDEQLEEYETKLKMIEKNIQACDKQIDSSIK